MAPVQLPPQTQAMGDFYALKTVVTVMLSYWADGHTDRTAALAAFEGTLQTAISSIDLQTVPQGYRGVFRDFLRERALTVVESARRTWEMPEPPTRTQ